MYIVFIYIIVIGVVCFAAVYVGVKKKREEDTIKEENNKKQIDNLGIERTKIIEGEDYIIIFDNTNRKFAVKIDDMDEFKIYKYEDFVECKIISNGGQELKVSSNAGKVVLGDMLLGGVGALAGMAGSRKVESIEKAHLLCLKIMVNDFFNPFYQIDFITQTTKTNSEEYLEAVKQIGEIVATFDFIQKKD